MPPNKKILAQIIKKARLAKGLTQEDLAKVLKIPRPSVSQIESGGRDLSASELLKIMETLELTFDDLNPSKNTQNLKPHKSNDKNPNKKIPYNKEKFQNLILYILEKCGSKPNVGETVLYKLLYFCDFDFFELFEKPLTGMKYKKMQFGPIPIQKLFNPAIQDMTQNHKLKIIKINLDKDIYQRKYINLTPPNLDLFNLNEIELVNQVINRLSDMNGRRIAAHAHGDQPWIDHEYDEEIHYTKVFERTGEYAQKDHEIDFLDTAASDILENLPPLSKDEYTYYMSLPDKK